MSSFDVKIGEEKNHTTPQNSNDLIYDNTKLQQEIQYLHSFMRKLESKYEKEHKRTNTLLTWILISLLIYVLPDIIIKIIKFLILANAL